VRAAKFRRLDNSGMSGLGDIDGIMNDTMKELTFPLPVIAKNSKDFISVSECSRLKVVHQWTFPPILHETVRSSIRLRNQVVIDHYAARWIILLEQPS